MKVAASNSTADGKKSPSLVAQLGMLAVLTVAAIAVGWFSGSTMIGDRTAAGAGTAREHAEPTRASEMAGEVGIVHIDPITTNLAAPADMWIRLELSLVFEGEADLVVAEQVHQDLLAYVRTVKVHQIDGASGFQHLKADLSERAGIRSDRKVREVLIRTMLVE
jgi:flagellar protein FliL